MTLSAEGDQRCVMSKSVATTHDNKFSTCIVGKLAAIRYDKDFACIYPGAGVAAVQKGQQKEGSRW